LANADRLYHRAEAGIARLPVKVRPAMFAARHVYAAIGDSLRQNDYDNITIRARTNKVTKLKWLGVSAGKAVASTVLPTPATIYAQPLPQTEFLIRAAAIQKEQGNGWSDRFISIMEQLHQHDQKNMGA
jgi:phytoene synthase